MHVSPDRDLRSKIKKNDARLLAKPDCDCWQLSMTVFQTICMISLLMNSGVSADPTHKDIEYATVGDHKLLLDIYQPPNVAKAPLVVWVHGGAWRAGSKNSVPITRLLHHGFAIASVDYRLSPVAKFPAQVHDIKAAIRFLSANAAKYRFDVNRFIVAGSSAGGHLAALVGVSNGVTQLEGDIGDESSESSQVHSIISFYGASNLQTILSQSTPHGLSVRVPALDLLLGGQPEKESKLAKLASPVTHVDASDPPLLLIHGDQDPQMPINQAHELHGKYQLLNLPVEFEVVHGGVHGGKGFFEDVMIDRVAKYLKTGVWK
jgi:acetyl esterase/lipase